MLLDATTRKLLEVCLRKTNKIEAIRIIRSRTGANLDTAISLYENFYQEILITHPEIANIPDTPAALPIDPHNVNKLTLVGDGLIFSFSFLFHDSQRDKTLLLSGSSSD